MRDSIQIKLYLPDILLDPILSNRYTTKGVEVSESSGGSPLGLGLPLGIIELNQKIYLRTKLLFLCMN